MKVWAVVDLYGGAYATEKVEVVTCVIHHPNGNITSTKWVGETPAEALDAAIAAVDQELASSERRVRQFAAAREELVTQKRRLRKKE